MNLQAPEATRERVKRAEAERQNRVSAAVGDPGVFGELYVRPYDDNWGAPLPDVAKLMLRFVRYARRGVILTPPEFLKTTMISQLYPLWLTAHYAAYGKLSLLAGMLVSEEKDLAERNLGVTAWHIEWNELLARDFVDVNGRRLLEPDPGEDKWTDDSIVVRRSGVSKDPTWQAKALKSAGVQGARLRHLIADDVVTPLTAHSAARQRESKRLWDTQFMRRVLEQGQAIVAGNFNNSRDLLSTLATRRAWTLFRRPSLHVPGNVQVGPDDPRDPTAIETLPERWSRRRLLDELSASPSTFAPVHLLRSATEGGTELQVGWVQRIALSEVPRKHRRLITIDPAPGGVVDPDPSFVAITVGCLSRLHLDVIASIAFRCETTLQVEQLAAVVARNQPVAAIGVSAIALDTYFKGAVLVGNPELRPLFQPVKVGQQSKDVRLAALGPYAKSGWLRIAESAWSEQTSSEDDRDQELTLGEEWAAFPTQTHDDRLDSLDVMIRLARDLTGGASRTVVSKVQRGTNDPDNMMQRDW